MDQDPWQSYMQHDNARPHLAVTVENKNVDSVMRGLKPLAVLFRSCSFQLLFRRLQNNLEGH